MYPDIVGNRNHAQYLTVNKSIMVYCINGQMSLMAQLRDLFHVYSNKFEFQFLRLHINNTNTFCFFMHNGHVPGIAK